MANQQQIKTALQQAYDLHLFAKNVLNPVFGNAFQMRSLITASIEPTQTEKKSIDKVFIYGKIELEDATEITCYQIELQPNVKIEQSKIAIQQHVRKLLTAGKAALINFVNPDNKDLWRLTFIAKDSQITEKGITEIETNPKRYTYLLGTNESCKTAAERFELLSEETKITLETVTNAFSVEKLSKTFFDEYLQHYNKFVEYITKSNFRASVFNADDKAIRDFTKKLLGRIVFLYFVQKKGWLGASNLEYKDGLQNFMTDFYKLSGANETFYNNYLKILFFDTLNKQRPEDNFKMPDGKILKIPFLNGGLFDKEKFDDKILTFKPELFHNALNEEDPKQRGFLDFLNSYNFTIYEDSPDEQTVAVDPEMLGHIFENLLEDNKDKGAYYTPKEIVHYMCQESLAEYLKTNLSASSISESVSKSLEQFIKHKKVNEIIIQYADKIDTLLEKVKICDPAIGSGAFPMGLLQEITGIKEIIAYKTGKEWKPAQVKQNIIQNSIYGVDIEKGAVDIARLRFWLSLVVDEEKPKPLPNLDYKIVIGNSLISKFEDEIIEINWSLANNPALQQSRPDLFKRINQNIKNIYTTQHDFFHSVKDKKEIKFKIRNLKIELLETLIEIEKQILIEKGIKPDYATKRKEIVEITKRKIKFEGFNKILSKLKTLKDNPEKPLNYFDWQLNFPEILNKNLVKDKGGFDIVIGNPPYIQLQKAMPGSNMKFADPYKNAKFQTFERTGDIYALFYEKGINLLKEKGIMAYITSNKWMRANYGKSLREFFAQKNPLKLIDLGPGVFETATVDTNIIFVQNKKTDRHKLQAITLNKNITQINKQDFTIINELSADSWIILSETEKNLKQKIENIGAPLKDWDININYGIKTGYNEAFIINGATKDRLIEQDPKSAEIIKPILRGRDIKRYKAEFADLWLINSHNGVKAAPHITENIKKPYYIITDDFGIEILRPKAFVIPPVNINNYPAVKKHLSQYWDRLKKRDDKGITPYNLRNCAYIQEFEKEKIIYPNMTKFLPFILDKEIHYYHNDKSFHLTGVLLYWLIAVFNSKLFKYSFKNKFPELQGGTRELRKVFFDKLPILKIQESEQAPFIKKVEQIIKNKEQGKDTSRLEQEIDKMVYELYGLTEEEIKIIETSVKSK